MPTPRYFESPGQDNTGWLTTAGDEGRGNGAATFRTAPRPSAFTKHAARTRKGVHGDTGSGDELLAFTALGYDQPGDSRVHRVAQDCGANCVQRI